MREKQVHGEARHEESIRVGRNLRKIAALGFQPPLNQWVLINHHCLPKGSNHRNWVNHYFHGGGSPGAVHDQRNEERMVTSGQKLICKRRTRHTEAQYRNIQFEVASKMKHALQSRCV